MYKVSVLEEEPSDKGVSRIKSEESCPWQGRPGQATRTHTHNSTAQFNQSLTLMKMIMW